MIIRGKFSQYSFQEHVKFIVDSQFKIGLVMIARYVSSSTGLSTVSRFKLDLKYMYMQDIYVTSSAGTKSLNIRTFSKIISCISMIARGKVSAVKLLIRF